MLSATITDLSGRTLSGQTIEGFYNSIAHSNPISVGLNCALGPKELESHLIELNRISEYFSSIHPNAGLPNALVNMMKPLGRCQILLKVGLKMVI